MKRIVDLPIGVARLDRAVQVLGIRVDLPPADDRLRGPGSFKNVMIGTDRNSRCE